MSAAGVRMNAARHGEWIAEWGLLAYLVLLPISHEWLWQVPTRFLLVAAACGGLVAVFTRGEIRFPRTWIVGLFMLFVVISSCSVLSSFDLRASGAAASKVLLRCLVVFLLVACAPREPMRWRRLGAALAISALLLSAISFSLAVGGVGNPWGGLVGPGFDYNSLCMFLIPTLPFAFSAASQAGDRAERWLWTLAAGGVTIVVYLSFSRIGWAAFLIMAAMLWWLDRPGRRRLAGASLAGLAVFLAFTPDLSQIVSVTDNTRFIATRELEPDEADMKAMHWKDLVTFNDRFRYAWKPALAIIREHPWLGAGYGPTTFDRLLGDTRLHLTHEHNSLLSVAVQSGVLAAATYAALLLLCVVRVGSALRRARPGADPRRAALVALAAALVAEYAVHGLAEPLNDGRMGSGAGRGRCARMRRSGAATTSNATAASGGSMR
jgi:O-antigen ligase